MTRRWYDDAKDGACVRPVRELRSEMDSRSERSGVIMGGTKVVVREPEPVPEPEPRESKLVMERIVRMEPVGERVTDWSGIVTERSSASLTWLSANDKNRPCRTQHTKSC